MLTALRAKSQITLPENLVERLGISVGDSFDISEKDGVICLTPVVEWPKEFDETLLKETDEERIARQLKALDELKEGLGASETLGPEFDEIIGHRVNITRDIDL